jgi:hypothetical protein
MGGKYLKVGQQNYIFKRYVSEKEMVLFKTHIGSRAYYFKKRANQIAFYVRNQSMSSNSTISKYNKDYKKVTSKE